MTDILALATEGVLVDNTGGSGGGGFVGVTMMTAAVAGREFSANLETALAVSLRSREIVSELKSGETHVFFK